MAYGIWGSDGILHGPTPQQQSYIDESAEYRYVLAIGDFASKKTAANLFKICDDVALALKLGVLPKTKTPFAYLLFHKKLSWVESALLSPLRSMLPPRDPNGNDLWFRMTNDENAYRYGSKENHVIFHCTGLHTTSVDPNDFKYSSVNFDKACGSQGDLLQEAAMDAVDYRMGRRLLPHPLRHQILLDSNMTKNFIFQRFYKRQVTDPERYYWKIFEWQNDGILDPEFAAVMESRSDAKKRAARDWDYAPGMAFSEYDERVSWIPFEAIPFHNIPKLKKGYDWGFAVHPMGCVWYGLDYDGNLFFFDLLELYRHDARQQAYELRKKDEELLQIFAERVRNPLSDQRKMLAGIFGGPDLNQQESGIGKSKGEQLADEGVYVEIVNPDVAGRYERDESKVTAFASALRVDPDRKHPVTGKSGGSRIYVSSRCERLAEQIQTAMLDPDNPKRLDDGPVRNRFETTDDRVHHWDLLQAAFIAVQESLAPKPLPKIERYVPQFGVARDTKLERLMKGRRDRSL